MNMRFVSLAGAILALSMTTPASAHHGWGGYQDTLSDVSGIVEQVSLNGAHARMKLRGVDGQIWDLVLSPPYMTFSVGIKETTIPLGATVKAQGHRHRDMNRFEFKTEQITMGQKTISIYPGRAG
jgi:Family of unknown function (DUF6152)